MTKMTKEIAREVAMKMTIKKNNDLKKMQKELKEAVTSYALSMIPKDIMICFDKHKEVFNTTSHLRFSGNGFNHEYLDLEKSLPIQKSTITPDKDFAKKIRILLDSIDDKGKELKTLQNEIEIALYNLKTYKNIEKEFPEAFLLLPAQKISTALSVNISSIREKL